MEDCCCLRIPLVGLMGCPHAWLKEESTLDRAARKDTRQSLKYRECTEAVFKELCIDGGEEKAKECAEVCGQ